jgi:pseudouridine-5'-phosphate glycosidase
VVHRSPGDGPGRTVVIMSDFHIRYGAEVAAALRAGRPVVACESTIISHGLPRPDNLRVAREIEREVRAGGAVPATIGMVAGELVVGLDDDQLTRLASADGVAKLSVRDLAVAAARGVDGATTVAATSAVAAAAGIGVFATGGLGGVHREAAQTFDESADLVTLPAAWLADRGTPVTLVGAVGDDEAGRVRLAELTALGVDCAVRRHAGASTARLSCSPGTVSGP